MKKTGNGNAEVCARNLLRLEQGDVALDGLRGLPRNLVDRSVAVSVPELKNSVRFLIESYEPRVEIDSILWRNSMVAIIETNPEIISKNVIKETESVTGPLMPGDERRILLDACAYPLAHQNALLQSAFESLDIDAAEGEVLTVRGAAFGLTRRESSPARIRLSVCKADSTTFTLAKGTKVFIGGVEFAIANDYPILGTAGTIRTIEAVGAEEKPDAETAIRQNSVVAEMHAQDGVLEQQNPKVRWIGCSQTPPFYLDYAVADEGDDSVFRARIKAEMQRPGDYESMAREFLPDATDVRVSLVSPGTITVSALHLGASGFAEAYGLETYVALREYLRSHRRRLHGDEILTTNPIPVSVSLSVSLQVRRGSSASVLSDVNSTLPIFCRGYSSIGGYFDLSDVINFF